MKLNKQLVQDKLGNARVGVPVTVYIAGSTTRPILYAADDTDGDRLGNPLTTDNSGYANFYVADGVYDIIVGTGADAITYPQVQIYDLDTFKDQTAAAAADAANVAVGGAAAAAASIASTSVRRQLAGFTLAQAAEQSFDAAITAITVSGAETVGDAGAGMPLVYDEAVDAAYVAANPTTSFIDAGGRGYRQARRKAVDVDASDGNTVQQNLDAKTRTFEQFLPVDYDYTADDCSAALVTAAAWSVANNAAVVFSRRYRIANCATITTDGFHFDFQGAVFDVLDTGAFGTITSGASGPIGLLFKGVNNAQLTGKAKLNGLGTLGVTRLAGMVFDSCTNIIGGDFAFDTMAAGLWAMMCSDCTFGNIRPNKMSGLQTFDPSGTVDAGTALVIAGCETCAFGDVHATLNHKPVVYFSLAAKADGSLAGDNKNCKVGFVSGTAEVNSPDSSLVALRSANQCSVAGAMGTGFTYGWLLQRFTTDTGLSIDGNDLGPLNVVISDTPSSSDAGLLAQDAAGMPIGRNHFGPIRVLGPDGSAAGSNKQIFGVLLLGGISDIDDLHVDGCYYGLQAYNAQFNIKKQTFVNYGGIGVRYGQGVGGSSLTHTAIRSGPTVDAGTAPFTYSSALGTGGISSLNLGMIEFSLGGIGTNPAYVFYDGTNSPDNVKIAHVSGAGSSGQARWGTDVYSVDAGRLLRPVMPTAGAFTQGDFIWNASATANGILGWQRLTTGSAHVPGTDWAVVRAAQQQSGWTADTGTAEQGSHATYTAGTTLTFGASYTQSELTALATRLAAIETAIQNASRAQKAIKDLLKTAGLTN